MLFDILKFHGASFTPQFWLRVFDSVLLPIFDHVRAEVTDTTTFTDDKRRAEVDAWLYDTCTRTLQHIVDIVVQYYAAVRGEPRSQGEGGTGHGVRALLLHGCRLALSVAPRGGEPSAPHPIPPPQRTPPTFSDTPTPSLHPTPEQPCWTASWSCYWALCSARTSRWRGWAWRRWCG